jgi:phage recombination protein Bet
MTNQIIKTAAETQQLTSPEQLRQLELIQRTFAANATADEFALFIHLAKKYDLDIFSRQIFFVKYGTGSDAKASIFCGRDGFLSIAHRSGDFDGLETEITDMEDGGFKAICRVYSKKLSRPIIAEVYSQEYSTGKNLWAKMPRVMIGKVAESTALRKAFNICGLYSPEEIDHQPAAVEKSIKPELADNFAQAKKIASGWSKSMKAELAKYLTAEEFYRLIDTGLTEDLARTYLDSQNPQNIKNLLTENK